MSVITCKADQSAESLLIGRGALGETGLFQIDAKMRGCIMDQYKIKSLDIPDIPVDKYKAGNVIDMSSLRLLKTRSHKMP